MRGFRLPVRHGLTGLAGPAWRLIGTAAGEGFGVLLVGAIVTHVRAGDSAREALPAWLILALDALYLAVALSA